MMSPNRGGQDDEEGNYRPTLADIDNEYLSELMRKRSKLWKIFWFLIFLLVTGFAAWLLTLLIQDYLTYSSYNLYYTNLGSSYTLPAITICNLNILDRTRLENEFVTTNSGKEVSYYDIYKDLQSEYIDRDGGGKNDNVEGLVEFQEALEAYELFVNYSMDISREVVGDIRFAKQSYTLQDIGEIASTERGSCLELNDNNELVQRVNGPTGALMITLDAETAKYLSLTESAGFAVILRQANETVISKEFGFSVAPGKRYMINLATTSVTRINEPWGSCTNEPDIMDNDGYFTQKECFLNQILYMYPKLQENCACFPWFFVQRFLNDETNKKYDPYTKIRMIRYWTEEISDESKRLSFNETCFYNSSPMQFTNNHIKTQTSISSSGDCAGLCTKNTDCRYFVYSSKDNDYLSANECALYESGAEYDELDGKENIDGLIPGDTQCKQMSACSISQQITCENHIMNNLMNGEISPPSCYEPCSYSKYSFSMTTEDFPTELYYNEGEIETNSNYSYEDAKLNLLQLVFYTDLIMETQDIQTASYEIQNLIAEMGGLSDLFIGVSFYTIFQILEYIIVKIVQRETQKKKATSPAAADGMITRNTSVALS